MARMTLLQTANARSLVCWIALLTGAIAVPMEAGCQSENHGGAPVAASTQPSAQPTPSARLAFTFPAASGLPPGEIIPTINRAASNLPAGQDGRIDEWLRGISLAIELLGPTKKFASDFGTPQCRYVAKVMQCSITAKLAENSKFFVTAKLACIDKDGKQGKTVDWEAPAKSKRGELVELAIPEPFLTPCLTDGGTKLGIELLASPCAIPFPHQVRCAGEHTTCRQTCKADPSCATRCEANRLGCLDVCKH